MTTQTLTPYRSNWLSRLTRCALILLSVAFIAALGLSSAAAQGKIPPQPEPWRYQWKLISRDFDYPIFLAGAPDKSGRLFVLEQSGQIFLLKNDKFVPTPFLDISERVITDILTGGYSERGLLGLAFHPKFTENGFFYVHYTNLQGDSIIARYKVSANPDAADPQSEYVILTVKQPPHLNHKGGMIAFGPDGYLYIGLGDGGSGGDPDRYAQNRKSLLGKLLRIDINVPDSADPAKRYAVPPSNPFVNNPDFAPEIWAWGLRNPWRFSFDRETGDLYIADVGQDKWEEIDFQPADSKGGQNYGWNFYEANEKYLNEPAPGGLTKPILSYNRSSGCSVTGGYVYRGGMLANLRGVYFFGDYCSGKTWTAYRQGNGTWRMDVFTDMKVPISSYGEDQNGELYLVTYKDGIYRLVAK
jgi:glucose/arabinose dehydrogenase